MTPVAWVILAALWLCSVVGTVLVWNQRESWQVRDQMAACLRELDGFHKAYLELKKKSESPEPGWFDMVLKKRLLVHTVAGKSFDGLLAEVVPDGIVLQQAKMLNGTPEGLPLVGGSFVPREQVLFTQLVD